jgi:hypothetical protein
VSFTLDANLLLYASDETSPYHERALAWLEGVAQGPELVYLFWPTALTYVRVATHPAVFARPLAPHEAMANIERLLTLPHVQSSGERDRFWGLLLSVVHTAGVRGNLVPDAHLVALMLENGVETIWTHDRDYRRFDGIQVKDPFA